MYILHYTCTYRVILLFLELDLLYLVPYKKFFKKEEILPNSFNEPVYY